MDRSAKLRAIAIGIALLATYAILGVLVSYSFFDESDERWGLQSSDGKTLLPPKYEKIVPLGDGLLSLTGSPENYFEREGLATTAGKVLLEPKYGDVTYQPSLKLILYCGWIVGPCGLMAPDGTRITEVNFNSLSIRGDGPFPFRRDKIYGYLDASGKIVNEGSYQSTEPFSDGVAWAQKDGKHVLIDRRFKVVYQAPVRLVERGRLHKGAAIVCEAKDPKASKPACGTRRLIDKSGRSLAAPDLRIEYQLDSQPPSLYRVSRDGKLGVVDHTGRVIVAPRYDDLNVHKPGLVSARLGKQHVLIDAAGRELLKSDARYGFADLSRDDGLVVFSQDGQEGVFNAKTAQQVIVPGPHSIRLTGRPDRFLQSGQHGTRLLDRDGKAVSAAFDELTDVSGGETYYYKAGYQAGFIDRDGRTIVEPRLLSYPHRGFFIDRESGVRSFAPETFAQQWSRRLSVLYGAPYLEPAFAIALALLLAGTLAGWGLTLRAGVAPLVADAGRALRFVLAMWALFLVVLILAPDPLLGLVAIPTLGYVVLRWRSWLPAMRWFAAGIASPGAVLGIAFLIDWIRPQTDLRDQHVFWTAGIVCAACLIVAAVKSRGLWKLAAASAADADEDLAHGQK